MNLLLVEDDMHKCRQIADLLESSFAGTSVSVAHSFQSALRGLVTRRPDVAVLDMTLPTYDVTEREDGGRTRTYGGRDLLYEIRDRGLGVRTVVITQFEAFGESDPPRTLEQLTAELRADFPEHFCGTVYYHPARSDWRNQLLDVLAPLLTRGTR